MYKKLDLPKILRSDSDIAYTPISPPYEILEPDQILTEDIVELFRSIGLSAKYVVLFSNNNSRVSLDHRVIHTDVTLGPDGKWKKIIAGLNFELDEESTNEFIWLDMSAYREVLPDVLIDRKFQLLNGIHYIERSARGIPAALLAVNSTIIDKTPTLVRTDVPHITKYDSYYPRVGVSIRFDETNVSSWDDIADRFEKYIV